MCSFNPLFSYIDEFNFHLKILTIMKISRPFEYLIPEFRIQRNFIRNNFRIFLKIKFRWILGFNLIPVKRLLFFQNMTVLDESARFFHSLKTFQLISTDSENQSFFFKRNFLFLGCWKSFMTCSKKCTDLMLRIFDHSFIRNLLFTTFWIKWIKSAYWYWCWRV